MSATVDPCDHDYFVTPPASPRGEMRPPSVKHARQDIADTHARQMEAARSVVGAAYRSGRSVEAAVTMAQNVAPSIPRERLVHAVRGQMRALLKESARERARVAVMETLRRVGCGDFNACVVAAREHMTSGRFTHDDVMNTATRVYNAWVENLSRRT